MNNLPILTETLMPIPETEVDFFNFRKVKNNDFSIMFDNFLRDELMWRLIKSIQQFYPTVKMYIAEQGIYHPVKDLLYQKLQEAGHEIIYTGFDAGLGICRNELVKAVKEPFVFYCDSDNLFIEDTKINRLIEILKQNSDIGFVGILELKDDKVWHYENNLSIENRNVIYKNAFTSENEYNNKSFFICDMTMNTGLARKELFSEVLWDERMKLAEHCDFFLQIKYFSKFKAACCKDVKITNQNISLDDTIYKTFRGRNNDFWILYKNKWNIDSVDGWKIPDIDNSNSPSKLEITSQQINEKQSKTTYKLNKYSEIKSVQQLLNSLFEEHITFWLLKNSCLEIVKYSSVEKLKDLCIGVSDEKVASRIKELAKNINFKLDVIIESNRKTKIYQINNKNFLVPIPVVKYLEQLYNKEFDKLMKE